MTNSRKQAYTGQQYFIMAIIVLFVFPVLVWVFRAFVGIPFILLSMVVELPTDGVWSQVLNGIQLLVFLFGLIASVWLCYKMWPRRKVIDGK